MCKKTILVFNRAFLPGYKSGGPIRTLDNLFNTLGNEYNFYLVTLDRDRGDMQPYKDLPLNSWITKNSLNVMYCSKARLSIYKIKKIIDNLQPGAIYLNSFFDPIFTQRVLWLRRFGLLGSFKIILAPRGELSKGALNLSKLRKQFYLIVARKIELYSSIRWHVSSTDEQLDLINSNLLDKNAEVIVAKNLVSSYYIDCGANLDPIPDEPLRICFLGRISRIKNLDFSIKIIQKLSCNVIFSIYGPIEDSNYWEHCKSLIAELPKHVQVAYKGPIENRLVNRKLRSHHLFLFPSKGENYGHVIFEALAAGLPVLLSDRTPWHAIADFGAGWEVCLGDIDKYVEIITTYSKLTSMDKLKMRDLAYKFAKMQVNCPAEIHRNRLVFK
jgi:glycosyltransferase involved in cell wall biosynthesis